MFKESVEKKIEDPKDRLTRLIQYTRGEAKDLIKNFLNDRPEYGYNNAMAVLHRHQKSSARFYQNSQCIFGIDGIATHFSFEENIQKNLS